MLFIQYIKPIPVDILDSGVFLKRPTMKGTGSVRSRLNLRGGAQYTDTFTHIGGGALTAHLSTSSSDGSEESDSVTESESESDAAESRRLNAFQLGSEVSLGKMVPHAQNSTSSI